MKVEEKTNDAIIYKYCDELEKALDKACEELYLRGYKAPCHNSFCVVATTGYSTERKKKICSDCIKEWLLNDE